MGCGCGCTGARSSVSSLSRKRLRGLGRSRFPGISDAVSTAAAAANALQFDPSSYIPPDVLADAQSAASYYEAASSVTSGAYVQNGKLQLTDQASSAAMGIFMAAYTALFPVGGAIVGAIMALGPHAAGGPGECVSDPPPGPALSQLRSWAHFQSWQSFNGPYGPDKPGTFEAWANPILEYNSLLGMNCFTKIMLRPEVLLARLIVAWNGSHEGPQRSIVRQFNHINTFGVNPGYDPIAEALYFSIIDVSGGYNGPDTGKRGFFVNSGPEKPKTVTVKPLVLHHFLPTTTAAKAPTTAAAPGASTSGTTVAVAGVAAAGGLFWAWKAGLLRKLF